MPNGNLKRMRLADVPIHKRLVAAREACIKAKSVDERYLILFAALHPGEAMVMVRQ